MSAFQLTVATPSDREIVMTRVFDAPRRLVFEGLTKPELLRRWLLGPEGWTMPVCEVDLKSGRPLSLPVASRGRQGSHGA